MQHPMQFSPAFSFGLGIFAPYGLSAEYYDNSGFRSIAIAYRYNEMPIEAKRDVDVRQIEVKPPQ